MSLLLRRAGQPGSATASASITLDDLTVTARAGVPVEVPVQPPVRLKAPPRRSGTITRAIRQKMLPVGRADIRLDDLTATSRARAFTPVRSEIRLEGLSARSRAYSVTHSRTVAKLDGLMAKSTAYASWESCIRDDDEFLLIHAA
jgi:hypothetical protein